MMLPKVLPAKPVTLFVTHVDLDPGIDHVGLDRIASVDLELDRLVIEELISALTKRLQTTPIGAVRVRFTGRMVH